MHLSCKVQGKQAVTVSQYWMLLPCCLALRELYRAQEMGPESMLEPEDRAKAGKWYLLHLMQPCNHNNCNYCTALLTINHERGCSPCPIFSAELLAVDRFWEGGESWF